MLCDIQPWVSDHSMYYLAKREVAQVCMISDFATELLYKTFLPCPPETPLSVHVSLLQCSIDRLSYRALSNTLMCALCCRLGAALRALRAPVRHSEQSNTDQLISWQLHNSGVKPRPHRTGGGEWGSAQVRHIPQHRDTWHWQVHRGKPRGFLQESCKVARRIAS